jgi:hypothetical protein
MAYNYTTPFGLTKNNLAGGPDVAGLASRAALGVATGGTSEIVSQVLNLIPSIFQGIIGGSQLSKANKIEAQNPRPTAEIAPSINKMVDYAYGQTLDQDVPGGAMYRGEIKGATAAGMKAASELGSGSEAYGMLGQLVGREQNQFGDLAKLTAERVAGKESAYMNTLGEKASEENRVWDWNKAQPYLMAAKVAAELRDSGMKNIYSGGANALGAGAEWASPDFNSSVLWGSNNRGSGSGIPMDELMKALNTMKITR